MVFLVSCGDRDSGGTGIDDPFTVVTFNTGTTDGLAHDASPDDGYTSAEAVISDEWYGNGLAWRDAIAAARDFFAELEPDIVGFQEIFLSDDCRDVPPEARAGFVCETWSPGDPTVAQLVLGDAYQIACHSGRPDKCAAVHRRFGRFRGCDGDFCLDGLVGFRVEDCGSGARAARGVIDRVGGGSLTVVSVHGTSGFSPSDQQCRVRQVEQVFVGAGDGEPLANGAENVILGDLNTDPGRTAEADPSAARWNDFVGPGRAFGFVSEVGDSAPGTILGILDIDHVMADAFVGSCRYPGVDEGEPPVFEAVYFDHIPVVCRLSRD